MNLRRIFFWMILFGGLLAYVLVFESPRPKKHVQVAQEQVQRVFALERSRIVKIQAQHSDRTVTISRSGKTWRVVQPENATVLPEVMDSLVAAAADAVVVDVVTQSTDDLSQYGLDQPAYRLSVFSDEPETPQTLLFGNRAPAGVSLYAKYADQDRIILVGTFLSFSLKTFLDKF